MRNPVGILITIKKIFRKKGGHCRTCGFDGAAKRARKKRRPPFPFF